MALFRFARQLAHQAIPLPKLQVFAVEILPGLFSGGSIVGRFHIKPPLDVAAFTDDVEPVIHVFYSQPAFARSASHSEGRGLGPARQGGTQIRVQKDR
jgi:hypothetical protein